MKSQSVELYRDLKAAGDETQLVLVLNIGMFVQVGPKPTTRIFARFADDIVTFFDNERKE
jgi:hypothetical protein